MILKMLIMVRSYYIEGFKNQFEESKIGIMKKVDKIKKKKNTEAFKP